MSVKVNGVTVSRLEINVGRTQEVADREAIINDIEELRKVEFRTPEQEEELRTLESYR